MSKIGIFYGSTTGVCEDVANKIAEQLGDADVYNIAGNEDKLGNLDLNGKKVAYFGSGDQSSSADTFVDGIGLLNDEIEKTGATVVGHTSTDGYDFNESKALVESQFLGLAIDEVNQSDLTDERIEAWTTELKKVL